MDSRKIKILNAIINSYIDIPVPVGSRTLSKSFNLGVSSATIRNEMADLEELGYLNKPHQSAGRIPSDKAYRFFVDEVFKQQDILDCYDLKADLIKNLYLYSENMQELYTASVKLLANMTNCTAYLMAPKKTDKTIQFIKLLKLQSHSILLLIVGNKGIVEKHIINSKRNIKKLDLNAIENKLNEELGGLDLSKIYELKFNLAGNMLEYDDFFKEILIRLKSFNEKINSVDIYCDGILNILNYEEYSDLEKAKSFMELIEDRKSLIEVLSDLNNDKVLQVKIGSENSLDVLQNSSIISTRYFLNDELMGSLGIIGPVRLDYQNLMKTVGIFGMAIAEVSEELFGVF